MKILDFDKWNSQNESLMSRRLGSGMDHSVIDMGDGYVYKRKLRKISRHEREDILYHLEPMLKYPGYFHMSGSMTIMV